jgi:hypothetical protein
MVVEPEPVRVMGLKLAVAPAGKPVALKLTVLLNPPNAFKLTLMFAPVPNGISLKPGVAAM